MKNIISRVLSSLIIVVLFCLNVSCPQDQHSSTNMWVGVGVTPDKEKPSVSITSHTNGGYMRKSDVLMRGLYSDDNGVMKIQVDMSSDILKNPLTKVVDCGGNREGQWEVLFRQSEIESALISDFRDGVKVIFTVKAYDAAYDQLKENYGFDTMFLYVDVNPPKAVLEKPESTTRFENILADFDTKYSMYDPSTITYFHNGEIVLSGFIEDNFAVSSMYIRFYKPSESNKNVRSEKPFAVTPVIDKLIKDSMTADDFSKAPELSEIDGLVEIGIPQVDANPVAWKYKLDTRLLTEDAEWIMIDIVTADGAGNNTDSTDDESGNNKSAVITNPWIYVCQDANTPRNQFNFDENATINIGGTLSGVAFDDDGITNIHQIIVPESDEYLNQIQNVSQWSSIIKDSNKDVVVVKDVSADENGVIQLNWNIDVPFQGGDYRLFVYPEALNGAVPENFYEIPPFYNNKHLIGYNVKFRVRSEGDPMMFLGEVAFNKDGICDPSGDSKYGSLTIIEDEEFVNKGYYPITGYFYDNEKVTCIKAKIVDENDNSADIVIYNGEWTGTFIDLDNDKPIKINLATGQIVERHNFEWHFNPNLFGSNIQMNFRRLKITLTAYDEEGHSGNDTINVDGDTFRPIVKIETPENNSALVNDTVFSGYVYDNVDGFEVTISCSGANFTFPTRTFVEDADAAAKLSGKESILIDGVKYVKRRFSTVITPTEINFSSAPVIVTARDRVGNESSQTVNISGDRTPPTVDFSVSSGANMRNDSEFTVMVYPRTFDREKGQRRDIQSVRLFMGTTDKKYEFSDSDKCGWTTDSDDEKFSFYSKAFKVSDFDLSDDGPTDLYVYVTDNGRIEGKGVLSFNYDNTKPKDMKITMPQMLSIGDIKALPDNADDITMKNYTSYLNKTVTFAGECTDNHKVNKTVLDIYRTDDVDKDGIKVNSISFCYNEAGDVTDDVSADGISSFSGVPSNFSFDMDTTKLNGGDNSGDGNYYIIMRAFDVAGNEAVSDKAFFKVLQDSDKPRITFDDEPSVVYKGYKIKGTAFDDDGFDPKNKFKYIIKYNANKYEDPNWNDAITNTPNKSSIYSFELPPLSDGDGCYTLWIQPVDKNGTFGKIYKLKTKVSSSEMPIAGDIIVDRTADGKEYDNVYAGKIAINVEVSANSGGNKINKIWYRIYDKTSSTPKDTTADIDKLGTADNKNGWYIRTLANLADTYTDNVTIDTNEFIPEESRLQIEVIAENNQGVKSIASTKQITVDNKKPSLEVLYPVNNDTINGKFKFSGTVNDSRLANVYVSYYDRTWDPSEISGLKIETIETNLADPNVPTKDKWVKMSSADYQNNSLRYEYDSTKLSDNTEVTLLIAAVDTVENLTVVPIDVTVNQDEDRPIVTLSEMDLTNDNGAKSSSNYIINLDGRIIGSVKDDDGVAKIEYKTKAADVYKTLEQGMTNFTYISQTDGTQDVYLRITDTNGGIFESKTVSDLYSIKLKDSKGVLFGNIDANGTEKDTVIYVMMDTNPPEITSVLYGQTSPAIYDIDDEEHGISTVSFGGTKGKLYLDVTATDANGIESIQYQIGNGGSLADIPNDGCISLDGILNRNETGSKTLEICVKDKAGQVTSKFWTLNIDNAAPYITLNNPGEVLDKTVTLHGTAYDASGLKGVYISYHRSLDPTNIKEEDILNHIGDDVDKWKYIGTSQSWDVTFDTTRITNESTDFTIVVAAIDNNGNVGSAQQAVRIDQDNDRPVIRLIGVSLENMSSANYSWLLSQSVSGTVTDSDGNVVKVEVKSSLDGVWRDIECRDNAFTYNSTYGLQDGKQKIYFRVKDAVGTVFSSDPSEADTKYKKIKIEDGANHKYYDDPVLYVRVDTNVPKIDKVMYKHSTSGFISVTTTGKEIETQTFGGTNNTTRYLQLKFDVSDDNGIDTVCIEFNGDTYDCTKDVVDANNCGQYSAIIDMYKSKGGNDIASGSDKTLTIKAKDKASKEALIDKWMEKSYTINIDNKPPVISFSSPTQDTVVYGIDPGNIIVGQLADNAGYSEIKVAYTESAEVSPTGWQDVITELSDDVTKWTMYYDGSSTQTSHSGTYHWPIYNDLKIGNGTSGTALIDVDSTEKQPLVMWMKAVDKLGNESTKMLPLQVLAKTNVPQIDITYPKNNATVGGTIRISGLTTIVSSSVHSVWLQIDPSGDIAFNDTTGDLTCDNNTGWYGRLKTLVGGDYGVTTETIGSTTITGIKNTNVFSWTIPINEDRNLNPVSGKPRKIAIRAIAVESAKGIVDSQTIILYIDKDAPLFGNTDPIVLKYNDGIIQKQKNYSNGVWIDGKNKTGNKVNWTLTGSIEDNEGIKRLVMNKTIKNVSSSGQLELINNEGNISAGYESWFEVIDTHGGYKDWLMKIPVDRDEAKKFGTVTFSFTAYEGSEQNKYTTAEYVINYDEEEPDLSVTLKTNNTIRNTVLGTDQEDLWFVEGSLNERATNEGVGNQSGFGRTAIFFTRDETVDGHTYTYVIDPMLDQSNPTNKVNVAVDGASVGDIAEKYGLWCRQIENVSINAGVMTLPSSPNLVKAKDNNIRPGGLCIVEEIPYRIKSISGQSITVEGLNLEPKTITVFFPIAQIIDHQASESGNPNKVFEYNGDNPATDNLASGDGDQMRESVTALGGDNSWEAYINSRNIYDGDIDVHFVAFDKAGNITEKYVSAKVENNPPRLAGISFGSDIDQNGDVTGDEIKTGKSGLYDIAGLHKLSGVSINGRAAYTFSPISDITIDEVFTIKGNIKFIPEIVGGNGGIDWILKIGGVELSGELFNDGSVNNNVRKGTINITKDQLDGVTGVVNTIELIIRDKSAGSGNYAKYLFTNPNVLLNDTKAPLVTINDFYWNSISDNSIYKDNGKLMGHIDLSGDLPPVDAEINGKRFDQSGGIWDRNPKVSGKIILKGVITDNVIVNKITVFDTNFIERENSKFLSSYGNLTNDGWRLDLKDEFDKVLGTNTVKWTLYWDTENTKIVSNGVAADFAVKVKAEDKSAHYDEKSVKVDVVPYITEVHTQLSDYESSNPSVVNRTALGHYPINGGQIVWSGDTGSRATKENAETVTLIGYNLSGNRNDSGMTIYEIPSSKIKDMTSDWYNYTNNGVPCLNNYNNNDAKGACAVELNDSNYAQYAYNRQPNGENNQKLTDDIYFDVWEFDSKAVQSMSNTIEQPVMKINPYNDMIGFAFIDGPLYFSMGGKNKTTGVYHSYQYWTASQDQYTSSGFVYDKKGNSYSIVAGGDDDATTGVCDKFKFMTDRWGEGKKAKTGGKDGQNALLLESIRQSDPAGMDRQRFRVPSMASSTYTGATHIYLAYYDTLNDEIRFRYGSINSSSKDDFDMFVDRETSNYAYTYAGGGKQDAQIIAGKNTGNTAGDYLSIGVIPSLPNDPSGDVAVFVWYDGAANTLKYMYNDNPTICRKNDNSADGWSDAVDVFSGTTIGEYCQLAVDNDGGVHIAAYDPLNMNLCYAYLPSERNGVANASSNFRTCVVDSSGVIGSHLTIDVAEVGNVWTPYICYYAEGQELPKMAWQKTANTNNKVPVGANDDMFTQDWECTFIPTPNKLGMVSMQHNKINVGVWKNADGSLKDNPTSANNTRTFTGTAYFDYTSYGDVYGNGTSNPVSGYVIKGANSSNTIETAQMR